MEQPYVLRDMEAEFSARRDDDPDFIRFTFEGERIYAVSKLPMKQVIELHKFLKGEIEDWLQNG